MSFPRSGTGDGHRLPAPRGRVRRTARIPRATALRQQRFQVGDRSWSRTGGGGTGTFMPNVTLCAYCGKALNVPLRLADQRVRCPYCHQEFAVPDETGSSIRPSPTAGGPRRAAALDEMFSRSMLPTPGIASSGLSPGEMICRLEPRTLRWLDISESVKDFLGRPIGQLRHQTFLPYLHPDDRAFAEDEFRHAAEQGERHDFVLRLQNKDGQWRHLRIYTQARYEQNGRLNHIRCNLNDITDEVQAEQALRHLTEQLTATREQLRQANCKLKEAQSQHECWAYPV
jgi:PAS domain S-box-containing protein